MIQEARLDATGHLTHWSFCPPLLLSFLFFCLLSFCCLRCDRPPDTSLLFAAVFRDPASISLAKRASESRGVKVLAVSRRSRLLPPGVVQISTIDGVEAEIVDEAKHCCLGGQRIAGDREGDPSLRSLRSALFEKAFGEDVVEGLDHGMPDLLRDPLAIERAAVNHLDAAIAKLGMVVADIDDHGAG